MSPSSAITTSAPLLHTQPPWVSRLHVAKHRSRRTPMPRTQHSQTLLAQEGEASLCRHLPTPTQVCNKPTELT